MIDAVVQPEDLRTEIARRFALSAHKARDWPEKRNPVTPVIRKAGATENHTGSGDSPSRSSSAGARLSSCGFGRVSQSWALPGPSVEAMNHVAV